MIFFIKGVRNVLLSSMGNSAHDKDVCAINVSTDTNPSLHFLGGHIGIVVHEPVGLVGTILGE